VPPALLTTKEVAQWFRVSERTVLNAVREGRLPAFRVRGRRGPLRYRRDDLEGLIGADGGPHSTDRDAGHAA
jgi:excisionase family DNA binding protein